VGLERQIGIWKFGRKEWGKEMVVNEGKTGNHNGEIVLKVGL
jgi:hypothetical protein